MTPSQLKELKKNLSEFYLLAKQIITYSTKNNMFPQYNVLLTLLQNLQFDNSDCNGYNHKAAIEKVNEIHNLIIALAKYYPKHNIILWVLDEVSTAIQYADMFEDLNPKKLSI